MAPAIASSAEATPLASSTKGRAADEGSSVSDWARSRSARGISPFSAAMEARVLRLGRQGR